MTRHGIVTRMALQAYALANRSGLLETKAGDALFNRAYFAYKRFAEDPYAALVWTTPGLFRGGDVIDVGANIGYTATVFADVVSDGYRVHAFEPERRNFERLQRNAARSGIGERIVPLRVAVGGVDGTVRLWRNPVHHGDHRVATDTFHPDGGDFEDVASVRLDTYVASIGRPVCFVKIDVQGLEPAVLHGMSGLLASPNVAVATEVSPPDLERMGFSTAELVAPLAAAGFTPHSIGRNGELTAVDAARLETFLPERGYADFVWQRT